MKKNCYVGLDPGKSGGIAWIHSGEVQAAKLGELTDIRGTLLSLPGKPTAVLEIVSAGGASTGGEKGRMGATSAFSFGRGYGWLEACLLCCEVPFVRVRPTKWQAEFSLGKKPGE
jgi:hypothetical protein